MGKIHSRHCVHALDKILPFPCRDSKLILFGLLLSSTAFFGTLPNLLAVEPVRDGDVGVVTLSETADNIFPSTATYPGSEYSGGLRFTNSPSTSTFDFTNQGTIGTTTSPMSQVNAAAVGTFTNQGSIFFSETMSASDLTNANNAFVTSAGGNLTVTNEILNNGQINIGGTIKAESLANSGTIQNASNLSIDEDFDQTTGKIQNIGTLSVGGTLTNSASINGITQSLSAKNISNSGTITNGTNLTATTTLTNSGTISDFQSVSATEMIINTATLSNIDSVHGPVANIGTLEDIEQFTGKLTNSGILKMTGTTAGITTIAELDNQSSGSLQVRIAKNNTSLTSDLYSVETATNISGGTITVRELASSKGSYKIGDRWTFLESGSIDSPGHFTVDTNITLPSLVKFETWHDNSNYYLEVMRAKKYAQDATTYNQQQFGQYLDEIGNRYKEGSDLENVLEQLDALSPDKGISPDARHAMAEMDGAVYGSLGTLGIQSQTIFNQQLADLFRPQSVCGNTCGNVCDNNDCTPCRHLWGKYYGVTGTLNSDGNASGGEYNIGGVMLGTDFLARQTENTCLRLGVSFGYAATGFQVDGLNEQADSDDYKGGVYFLHSRGNSYLFGNVHYGYDKYYVTRNITFLNRENRGYLNGNEITTRIEKGWNTVLGSALFQPFAAFQYAQVNTNSFEEQGDGVTVLSVKDATTDSYRSEVGSRFVFQRGCSEEQSRTFNIKAVWLHEFGETYGETNAQFNNTNSANFTGTVLPYNVRGNESPRDWFDLGCGINYTIARTTFYGGYDCLFNDHENYHTGSFGIVCLF